MADRVEVRLNKLDIRNFSVRAASKRVDSVLKEIEVLAKLEARGPYSTGRTANSINRRLWVTGSTVRGEVRAGTWYAHIAHGGAAPHIITPRGHGYPLRFFWRKVGHEVKFMYVSHPGYPGKHFLSGPARIVGRRHRFTTIIYEE
jgi:hypothetical protein